MNRERPVEVECSLVPHIILCRTLQEWASLNIQHTRNQVIQVYHKFTKAHHQHCFGSRNRLNGQTSLFGPSWKNVKTLPLLAGSEQIKGTGLNSTSKKINKPALVRVSFQRRQHSENPSVTVIFASRVPKPTGFLTSFLQTNIFLGVVEVLRHKRLRTWSTSSVANTSYQSPNQKFENVHIVSPNSPKQHNKSGELSICITFDSDLPAWWFHPTSP